MRPGHGARRSLRVNGGVSRRLRQQMALQRRFNSRHRVLRWSHRSDVAEHRCGRGDTQPPRVLTRGVVNTRDGCLQPVCSVGVPCADRGLVAMNPRSRCQDDRPSGVGADLPQTGRLWRRGWTARVKRRPPDLPLRGGAGLGLRGVSYAERPAVLTGFPSWSLRKVAMAAQPAGDELLTPGGVAALLYVDRKTVSRWAQSGKLGSIRTPGGHRRYLKSEIMAIRDGNYDHQDSGSLPSPRLGEPSDPDRHQGEVSDAAAKAVVAEAVAIALEAEAAETAQAVVVIAAAVALAATKAADAAERARGAREVAAKEAAHTVALEAERTATKIRRRADVAASRVAEAAAIAAGQISGADAEILGNSTLLAERVAADAAATARETTRAAAVVATAVAVAADHMAQMALTAEDSYEAEVASVAEAMLFLTTETATRVAAETEARAAGVAHAASEAADAAYVSISAQMPKTAGAGPPGLTLGQQHPAPG
jgi:excisionase family DNA binding protein